MSNGILRQQAGAAVAGQKVGGQFKAHVRTEAAPPMPAPQTGEESADDVLARAVAHADDELGRQIAELERKRSVMKLRALGEWVQQKAPDVTDLVVGHSYYGDDVMFAAAYDRDGNQIDLGVDLEVDLEQKLTEMEIPARTLPLTQPSAGRETWKGLARVLISQPD